MENLTRRQVLKRTAQAMACTLGWCATASSSLAREASKAGRRLPVSLCDAHLKVIGKDNCWSAVHAVGADGLEVLVNQRMELPELSRWTPRYSVRDADEVRRLARDSKKAGVQISALGVRSRLDARPETEIRWISEVVRVAKQLEVPVVRIGLVPRKIKDDELLELAISALKKVLAETRSTGVSLGIENDGKTTNDSGFLDALFDAIEDPRLGLTLNTGNFYWYGHPLSELYRLYERYAPRTVHTRLKTIKYPTVSRDKRRSPGWEYAKYSCPLYEGDVDIEKVLKILRAADYSSDLCVENDSIMKFPSEERRRVLAKEIDHVKWLHSL